MNNNPVSNLGQELQRRFAEIAEYNKPDHPGRLALDRLTGFAKAHHDTSGGKSIARFICWLDAENRADLFAVLDWFSKTDTRHPAADAAEILVSLPQNSN